MAISSDSDICSNAERVLANEEIAAPRKKTPVVRNDTKLSLSSAARGGCTAKNITNHAELNAMHWCQPETQKQSLFIM
jgi:hypothetical protein